MLVVDEERAGMKIRRPGLSSSTILPSEACLYQQQERWSFPATPPVPHKNQKAKGHEHTPEVMRPAGVTATSSYVRRH